MKALSIRQPWAWAILHAGKRIENRSWSTRYRGRFLIHASAGMTRAEWNSCLRYIHAISVETQFPSGLALPSIDGLQRGGIVGEATLVDCVTVSDSPWFFGPYGFVLEDVRPLPFRPYRGALGFFEATPNPQET